MFVPLFKGGKGDLMAQNATWLANGNNITYTFRKVGVNTSNPLYPLDVKGNVHSSNAYFDSLAQALYVISQKATIGSINISTNTIVSPLGSISFGSNVLSTLGNISGANITALGTVNASAVIVTDGNQGAGKVLTSDAGGMGSWQQPIWSVDGNIITDNYDARDVQISGTFMPLAFPNIAGNGTSLDIVGDKNNPNLTRINFDVQNGIMNFYTNVIPGNPPSMIIDNGRMFLNAPANYSSDFSSSYSNNSLVDKQYVDNKVAGIVIPPPPASFWISNANGVSLDSSIINKTLTVDRLQVNQSVSIGSFNFTNGANALPQTAITDSIRTQYRMALKSTAGAISLASDTVNVGKYVDMLPGTAPGSGQLNVTGSIKASGNISSGTVTTGSIVTSQLTIDTLHALTQVAVNHSLLISKETAKSYAEVSTRDTSVALVLQKDSLGRVFIGTPLQKGGGGGGLEKLSVMGNVGVSGNLRIANLSGTGDRQLLVDANGNLKAMNPIILCGGLDANWKTDGNNVPDGCNPFIGTLNAKDLVFKTDANNINNITPQMVIAANGNVGIGTANPQHQLHLNSIDPSGGPNNTAKFLPLDTTLNFDSLGNYVSLPIQTNPVYRTLQITNNTTGDQATNGLILGVSGTAGFLDLQENAPMQIKAGGGLSLYTTNGNAIFRAYNGAMILQSKGVLRMNVGNPMIIAMQILSNGNVGIGTTNPVAKLEVNGSISIYDGVNHSTDDVSLFFGRDHLTNNNFGEWGIQYWANPNGVGGLNFWKPSGSTGANGNNFLFLADDGKTGVGTNDPQYKLDVAGQVNATGYFVNGIAQWQNSGNDIYYNSGNVAIGTTPDPNYMLVVCGPIRTQRVVVKTFTCDFVFDNNYQLLSLKERKAKVFQNKHLMNVPSAKEMDKNGNDLGATTMGLLQNVEEQELYLYNHDDRINKLENENVKLKIEMEALKKAIEELKNKK